MEVENSLLGHGKYTVFGVEHKMKLEELFIVCLSFYLLVMLWQGLNNEYAVYTKKIHPLFIKLERKFEC